MRRLVSGAAAVATILPLTGLAGQTSSFDLSIGRWWRQGPGVATLYSGTWRQRFAGPIWWGVGLVHVEDQETLADMTTTGGEFGINLGLPQRGPFAAGTVGLGMRHGTGDVTASWSARAGYTFRLGSVIKLGAELGYRADDPSFRGFWRLNPTDRSGVMLQAGLGLSLGGNPRRSARPTTTVAPAPLAVPSEAIINNAARDAGASETVAALTSSVVQTAIDQMGTPYHWGGTDSNGFDCSGLIQYAYAQHGIILPRVSRDQARTGHRVDPNWHSLRPGDILAFAVEGSRVSHVGLYVGEGRFIHSSSDGVQLSSLTSSDAESRWWQDRWVAARRIVE
jgi:cell wall-associated NlpC family hydrolase